MTPAPTPRPKRDRAAHASCIPVGAGHRALWCAVIQQAVDDYACEPGRNSIAAVERERVQAARWLFRPSSAANSFNAICDALHLDAWAIRRQARRLRRAQGGSLGEKVAGLQREALRA
jgi:hypothetical protein